MTRKHCAPDDLRIIAEALNAAIHGPFFPEWEFQTLFGIGRAELTAVYEAWPEVDESQNVVDCAVRNSLSSLTGYPHGLMLDWDRFLSVPPHRLVEVLRRWCLPGDYGPADPMWPVERKDPADPRSP
jgi:hypothetical protein